MFGLVSGLYEKATEKPEIPLMLVGADGVGKTTVLELLRRSETRESFLGFMKSPEETVLSALPSTRPTVGLNMARLSFSDSNMVIWDLGGGKSVRSLWRNYFHDTFGLCLVASEDRGIDDTLEILENLMIEPSLQGKPVLIIINIQNTIPCESKLGVPEITSPPVIDWPGKLNLQKWDDRSIRCVSLSTLNPQILRKAFSWLLKESKDFRINHKISN